MLKSLKLYEPKFENDELEAVKEVFKTGILTSGAEVEKLEVEFAKYVGSKYAIAVNSATSAIFLSLQCEKVSLGIKRVIVPSVTFVSVANMVLNSGLKFEFNDEINVGNWYMLGGTTIIDSAHHLHRNCYIQDSIMCFSFYPTKLLGSCEGGIIATNNNKVYRWLRKARNNGMERNGMFDWDYTVEFAGWKMNMNNIQAAIARTRLKKLDDYNKKREKIRDFYNKIFLLQNKSLHIYPLQIDNRDETIKKLAKYNIQTSVHFKPIHLQPAYQKYRKFAYPKSEDWGNTEISIPLHENLKPRDLKYLILVFKKENIWHCVSKK